MVGSTLKAFQVVIAEQVVFHDYSISIGWHYIPYTVQVSARVINSYDKNKYIYVISNILSERDIGFSEQKRYLEHRWMIIFIMTQPTDVDITSNRVFIMLCTDVRRIYTACLNLKKITCDIIIHIKLVLTTSTEK